MNAFESFVYLDVEKTGSSFISRLLGLYCRERCVGFEQHAAMGADCDRSKFYFISVRDPLDAYLSLYSYGCGGKGRLRSRLTRDGMDDFYDATPRGFARWLAYVLQPENASALREGYGAAEGGFARLLGFQSFRYFRLAVPDAAALIARCDDVDALRRQHAAHALPGAVIRYERFVEDLCALISGPLSHAIGDVEGALAYARSAKPVNASQRVDAGRDFAIPERLRRRLARREWLLGELFGY